MDEKKYKATKITSTGEYSEEMTYSKVGEMLLSSNFMVMLDRLKVGEYLYYNDRKIEFRRVE